MRGVVAPESPLLVPNLEHVRSQDFLKTETCLVRFRQTKSGIGVFGSAAVAELDWHKNMVSADVTLAEVTDVSAASTLSDAAARSVLARFTNSPPAVFTDIVPPVLTFFLDESAGAWHLVWHYRKIPAAPPGFGQDPSRQGTLSCGLPGQSPRRVHPHFDYLVDAHNGAILRSFSSAPTLAPLEPCGCQGYDEEHVLRQFLGTPVGDGLCEMHDPLRRLKTYDKAGATYDSLPFPADPVRCNSWDFGSDHKAAVSAHSNAETVIRFFRGVLARNGIDDNNMELVSVVNCTASDGHAPEWRQAQWFDNRMWYGQYSDGNGNLRSSARFLDVIAHELTHGVTEHSAGLQYFGESGALDESFSDIFGVVINNYGRLGGNSTADQWDWRIGVGLSAAGGPLRDLSNPALTHLPSHVKDVTPTLDDCGGVHTSCAIHSKAAYNVFTTRDAHGALMFRWMDVTFLYYLCLCRLPGRADFAHARRALVEAAKTFFRGRTAAELRERIAGIEKAYDAVGIQ